MLLCSGSFHESWSLIRTTEVVRPRSIPNTQKYTSLSIYNICNQSTSISPSGATGSFPACQVILSSTMNRWPAVTKAHSMGLPSSHHRPQIVRIKHTHIHERPVYNQNQPKLFPWWCWARAFFPLSIAFLVLACTLATSMITPSPPLSLSLSLDLSLFKSQHTETTCMLNTAFAEVPFGCCRKAPTSLLVWGGQSACRFSLPVSFEGPGKRPPMIFTLVYNYESCLLRWLVGVHSSLDMGLLHSSSQTK